MQLPDFEFIPEMVNNTGVFDSLSATSSVQASSSDESRLVNSLDFFSGVDFASSAIMNSPESDLVFPSNRMVPSLRRLDPAIWNIETLTADTTARPSFMPSTPTSIRAKTKRGRKTSVGPGMKALRAKEWRVKQKFYVKSLESKVKELEAQYEQVQQEKKTMMLHIEQVEQDLLKKDNELLRSKLTIAEEKGTENCEAT